MSRKLWVVKSVVETGEGNYEICVGNGKDDGIHKEFIAVDSYGDAYEAALAECYSRNRLESKPRTPPPGFKFSPTPGQADDTDYALVWRRVRVEADDMEFSSWCVLQPLDYDMNWIVPDVKE